jgi:hypothetical protein
MRVDWFRTFTFSERLRILLGFNANVLIRIPCQHNPGKVQPLVKIVVSPELTADSQVKKDFDDSVDKDYPTTKF